MCLHGGGAFVGKESSFLPDQIVTTQQAHYDAVTLRNDLDIRVTASDLSHSLFLYGETKPLGKSAAGLQGYIYSAGLMPRAFTMLTSAMNNLQSLSKYCEK